MPIKSSQPKEQRKQSHRIFVARTFNISQPQAEVDGLLGTLRQKVEREGTVRDTGNMHLTLVRGGETSWYVGNRRMSKIGELCTQLETFLKEKVPDRQSIIPVDSVKPFGLYGVRNNVLALNIAPTEQLVAQRAYALEFLQKQFGPMSGITPFRPHVSVAVLRGSGVVEARADLDAFSSNLTVPSHVVLNGLAGYIDSIHLAQDRAA